MNLSKWQESEPIGRLLREIDEVFQENSFVDIDIDLGSNEEKVGEMNDFEKALFTLIERKKATIEKIRRPAQTKLMPQAENVEIARTEVEVEWLTATMWNQIELRTALFKTPLGIREGFRIVKIQEPGIGREIPWAAFVLRKSPRP